MYYKDVLNEIQSLERKMELYSYNERIVKGIQELLIKNRALVEQFESIPQEIINDWCYMESIQNCSSFFTEPKLGLFSPSLKDDPRFKKEKQK